MADATTFQRKRRFSAVEERRLMDDDVRCSKTVLAVLLAVVVAGALTMAVTVLIVV